MIIFASGSGSNAENLVTQLSPSGIVVLRIYTNNPNAGVIQRAQRLQIPITIISKEDWKLGVSSNWYQELNKEQADLIVLAGFLLKIPDFMVSDFPSKIINLHPSLLPKFGGKGMYGNFVHQKVIDVGETHTGITIHYVNENYDDGGIIFQAEIPVHPSKNPEELAARIHELEHIHLPRIVKNILI
jgi:phosphoribosylglycinamide formyltransferase-1